jgi:universal stress protein A
MPRDFKTIMCGTDFTEDSYHALAYALRLAKLANGTLIIVHSVDVPSGDVYTTAEWPRTFDEARARAQAMLAEVHAKRLEGYSKAELLVEVGPPDKQLVALAAEHKVDLLVTATHERSELADLIMGSVAEKLIRHAPCPVLVVRHGVA